MYNEIVQKIELNIKERRITVAYNYQKLLGKIVEVYGTQYEFAKALNISEHSLSLKLNNKVNFKQPEITKACELLGINSAEMSDYFFAEQVQNI